MPKFLKDTNIFNYISNNTSMIRLISIYKLLQFIIDPINFYQSRHSKTTWIHFPSLYASISLFSSFSKYMFSKYSLVGLWILLQSVLISNFIPYVFSLYVWLLFCGVANLIHLIKESAFYLIVSTHCCFCLSSIVSCHSILFSRIVKYIIRLFLWFLLVSLIITNYYY